MKHIAFYYDPVSPYVWLACTQIEKLQAAIPGIHITLIPVLFYGLLDAHGQRGPVDIVAKRNYIIEDVLRWAARYRVRFRGTGIPHPYNPLKALRMCLGIEDDHARLAFAIRIAEAAWSEGQDVTKDVVLLRIADALGLSGTELLQQAQHPTIKERLKHNTATAVAHGIFGVPTFGVDQELFWGHDRMALLTEYCQGTLAPVDRAEHTTITQHMWGGLSSKTPSPAHLMIGGYHGVGGHSGRGGKVARMVSCSCTRASKPSTRSVKRSNF